MHNKEVLSVAQVKHRCGVDATGVLYDEKVLCVSAQEAGVVCALPMYM